MEIYEILAILSTIALIFAVVVKVEDKHNHH
jgi:hypothetical protein